MAPTPLPKSSEPAPASKTFDVEKTKFVFRQPLLVGMFGMVCIAAVWVTRMHTELTSLQNHMSACESNQASFQYQIQERLGVLAASAGATQAKLDMLIGMFDQPGKRAAQ